MYCLAKISVESNPVMDHTLEKETILMVMSVFNDLTL